MTELIVKQFNKPSCDNIQEVIEALGKIRDPRAIEPLIDVLKDCPEYMNEIISFALYRITDHMAFDGDYQYWKDWWVGQKEAK